MVIHDLSTIRTESEGDHFMGKSHTVYGGYYSVF